MAVKKRARKRGGQSKAAADPPPPEPAGQTVEKAEAAPPEVTAGEICPVVGVGASAGGLEAFTEVLERLPPDPGLALVFVQHLDPKHASVLTELLSRATEMPVVQVTDGLHVETNHVFVIPPNSCISIGKGTLRVEPRPAGIPHMPIDHFFRSLAEDQGNKAFGVVLSGTASDGTLGLKAIKAAGGITFAQDPTSAKYDGMPRSAIATGCVDSVLNPAAVASELVRLCRHPYLNHPPIADGTSQSDKDFAEIFGMLRAAKGVDFAHYKPGTVRRRTLRRMALHKLETPADYIRYIKHHHDELEMLFHDMLINVTGFFREPGTFQALRSEVFPIIFRGRALEDPIRVWVPGCATGEEVYSIAIGLIEYMREVKLEIPLSIFGTDLSEAALEHARAGIYTENIAADVSPERLRRFFVPVNGTYQIARFVRDGCVFARQNLTRDPPFSRLDLITCRNVLIYFGPELQHRVMRLFHYAVKPNGYLVLGASESIGHAEELFAPIDKQHKIYARRARPANVTNDFGSYEEFDLAASARRMREFVPFASADAPKRVDQMILARYSPAAVVVDKDLRILQFRGRTERYLGHPPGEATLNLTKLARGGIGVEVRKLIQKAERKSTPVKSGTLAAAIDGDLRKIVLSVIPVHGAPEPQFLVVFEEAQPEAERKAARPAKPEKHVATADHIRELEMELAATRQYLQSVIEEQEASTEELKSAHEEVQSANEELQSTNEELLTAKEELQSTNEELTTVNQEMQNRNVELHSVNNDLINLLSSVNIPIIMLGNDLRIRRFTPQAERILNVIPADIGRPIGDFRPKIHVPDLVDLCQEVVDRLTPREREVQDADGRTYSMWLRPYRTSDNRIDGVVLAMLDITERKQSAEARYRRLFETAQDGIIVADAVTGEIVDANPFIGKLFGYARPALMGARFWEAPLFRGTDMDESIRAELQSSDFVRKVIAVPATSGERIEVEIVASPYEEGERPVIQFNIRDVSARRKLEQKVHRSEEQVRQAQKMEAVGRLAGGIAHDFNNVLTAVLGYADLLGQEIGDGSGREMLDQIHIGAERAIALTKQLLAFGRKEVVNPEVLDVNEVISEMRQMASVMLSAHVELTFDLSRGAGRVLIDRTQLEQVVLNLVLNARDAMPGGGRITVSTENVDVDESFTTRHPAVPIGRYTAITVRDTGGGMDEDTQAHLFEPFFTTKPKGKGVGLGLSTSYNIVKQDGGYIWAYSELGVGSTFTVYLPRVEAAATRKGAPAGEQQARGTETILLVEDEPAVRSLTRRFLELRGYSVLEAPSGPDALRLSREYHQPIHLLLTDVVMPRMSGRELAFQLANERPQMKVLYMSGHTEDAIIHHGVLEQGLAFLQKPFTQQILAERVRGLLDEAPERERAAPAEDAAHES